MRRLAASTTLALILAAAAPLAAQDKQDSQNKQDSKGGLGGVLDTLGNVLGTGTQKLHGTVVANEGSTFVLRTDDHRTYRVVSGTVQEAGRQRVLFTSINGLPYLAPNQPATLYYEQGPRQEIVGVWIQPGTAGTSATSTGGSSASAPSASVSAAQSLEGSVESVGVSELKLQTSDGRSVVVDTSG